jgi:hypothetical protein
MTTLRAMAQTRAAQLSRSAVYEEIRSSGHKLREIETSDLRTAIAQHLARHPEIIERATEDVRQWALAGMLGAACRAEMLKNTQNENR